VSRENEGSGLSVLQFSFFGKVCAIQTVRQVQAVSVTDDDNLMADTLIFLKRRMATEVLWIG
jgi:hypothetical protein